MILVNHNQWCKKTFSSSCYMNKCNLMVSSTCKMPFQEKTGSDFSLIGVVKKKKSDPAVIERGIFEVPEFAEKTCSVPRRP